uniref:Uncharacterized protein n=1 Tax=Chenopodium quinoa TaxID=63459 RepID=A0A803LK52_CHEQI
MVDATEIKLKKVAVTEEDVCTLLQRYSATTVLSLLREVAQFPEDDDSDLEYELEARPPVSNEAATEALNCVKVLASGSAIESSIPNGSSVEGRTLNINSSHEASGNFGEGLDANGLPINRKRRKPWSEEEDLELITAVQKFGEGSWAAILKGEFKGNRNATQLAQRWNIIRKKQGSLNIGGAKIASPQPTEAQLATRRALDMAFKDKLSTGCSTVGNEPAVTTSPKISGSKTDLTITGASVPSSQPQSSPVTCVTSSVPKAQPQKKVTQPSVSTDSIQATAVAAGARIVSPSAAASMFKAVQSKKAMHIRGDDSLIKTSAVGCSSPLPPNVHFIRTGLSSTPTFTASAGTASCVAGQQAKGNGAIKPPVPPAAVSQLPKARTPSAVGLERTTATQQMENRTSTAVDVQGSDTKLTRVQEDNASHPQCLPDSSLDKCRATSTVADVGLSKCMVNIGSSQSANVARNEVKDDACKQIFEGSALKSDNEKLSAVQNLQSGTSGVEGTPEVPPSRIVDEGAEKMEVSKEVLVSVKISNQTNL